MNRKIYFATKNNGKVASLQKSLSPFNITIVHLPLDLPEPRTYDLQTIAKEKVLYAYQHADGPTLALDSGFYVHALNGFPRTFVNFALETIGLEGLLKLVQGKSRLCEFKNCLAYMDEQLQEPVFFSSSVEGSLAETPRGQHQAYHWSDLFSLFIPKGYEKTLAEMTREEYDHWRSERHEHSFTTQFATWLRQH